MSVDNPYYFYNDKSPKTPDSSSKGFSFFRRRNSKGSSSGSSPKNSIPQSKSSRTFNSATLSQDVAILGSPRGSLGSMGSFCGTTPCFQSFELQQSSCISGIYRRSSGTYRERLGSYNESLSYSENDDVFVQVNNRNISSKTLPSGITNHSNRRHSLGHLGSRDKTRCNSFSDEVPKMIAPKPPAMSPMKYRANRRRESCNNSSMDDILIITTKHSERAILWANFLKNRFDKITKQRGRKPFNFLHIKIDEGPFPIELTQKCQQTALQIVILCPAFLALSHSYLMTQLSGIINPEKVLGILLEVSEDKVLEIHKAALPSFRKWKKCSVRDNDQSLIGNILGIATDILGRALCQRPPCHENNGGGIILKSTSTEDFTVVPRKVKIGQNKVLILLNEPLTKEDWIKITIEKSGEIIEINSYKKRNPYTIQFNIPETCMEISTMIEVRIVKNEKDLGSRPVKCESRLRELEQLLRTQDSPIEFMCHSLGIGSNERDSLDLHLLQCFQKNMPPNFHLLAGHYDKQNSFITSKESRPEEFPTLLHFAAKWGLERLCLQLLECPGGDTACEMRNYSGKTPAEIADQEGFHKIAKSLKSFSQIHEFTTMYHYFKGISDSVGNNKKVVIEPQVLTVELPPLPSNKCDDKQSLKDEDVVDNKFEKVQFQPEYMEMSSGSEGESSRPTTLAVTNLNYINIESQEDCNLQSCEELIKKLDQVKIIEDTEITSNELHINEPPYYQSNENNKTDDEFSKECSNVLENCNSTTIPSQMMDYMTQPSNIPVMMTQNEQSDYMIQPSNRPVFEANTHPNYMNESSIVHHHHQQQYKDDDSHLMMNFEKKKSGKNGTLKRSGSDTSSRGNNADDELAEIMYDFKNNVLTIREVEQLVEKWKNRNDVKQSFKEKQEQIEKLREEYERVQEQMKAKLKRPTPFERVKKLFSRNKHNSHNEKQQQHQRQHQTAGDDIDDAKSSVTSFCSTSNQRPMSTLSLQSVSSSSSSGRMSTVSACSGTSLGDSGTHSDHEDRRQIFTSNCRIGSPGSLMDNYLIPPAPRPVSTPASTPTPVEEKDRLMFNRTPNSPTNLSEHYIIFPSNVPVFSSNNGNNDCINNINDNNSCNNSNNGNSNNNNTDSLSYCGLNTIIETKETSNDVCIVNHNNKNNNNEIQTHLVQNQNNHNNFSSFKPLQKEFISNSVSSSPPPLSSPSQVIDVKKEMSEVYQNINGLDKMTKASDNIVKLVQQDSCESNSMNGSLIIDKSTNENNNEETEHNYMNI